MLLAFSGTPPIAGISCCCPFQTATRKCQLQKQTSQPTNSKRKATLHTHTHTYTQNNRGDATAEFSVDFFCFVSEDFGLASGGPVPLWAPGSHGQAAGGPAGRSLQGEFPRCVDRGVRGFLEKGAPVVGVVVHINRVFCLVQQ